MRVAVYGFLGQPEVKSQVASLGPLIAKNADVQYCDLEKPTDPGRSAADLALVFGGDGTILRAARQMGYLQVPALGINIGKLGFLADVTIEQAREVLTRIFKESFTVTEHLMLECIVHGSGEARTLLGLNEVVIHVDPPLHLVEIDLAIDDEPVATFRGDGLILSTPIGSTGHNLSAGGPILRQELAAFVITPICPHALTYRPLVDGAERTFTVALHAGSYPARLIVDGQENLPLEHGQRVIVKQAPVKFKRIRVPTHSYYATLREKLHWAAEPNFRTGRKT
jgi:NAD+ kinase